MVDLEYIACTAKFCLLPTILHLEVPIKVSAPLSSSPTEDFEGNVAHYVENYFPLALLLIFFFGFLTSFTPCVYPLIPITLAVLGANKERSKGHSLIVSLSYVVGIAMTYAILGVIAAKTGQLFGSLISHPITIVVMSGLLFAMGLSLFGLFEIQAPSFIRNRSQNIGSGGGVIGAFLSGTVAGIIASPCVGPVLVGILAYIAQTQNSWLGFILLFTFAMGFGLLFIVLGTFSQLLHKLPRSGNWMNRIKYFLGAVLIGLSIYYAWPLLRELRPQTQKSVKTSDVQWLKYSEDLVAQAKADGKPVIIDFYADWCLSCVEMDELTFSQNIVSERTKKFVMLKVDATKDYPGLKETQSKYEVFGLPTMIFIDTKGTIQEDLTLTGFEEAELFAERMDKVDESIKPSKP